MPPDTERVVINLALTEGEWHLLGEACSAFRQARSGFVVASAYTAVRLLARAEAAGTVDDPYRWMQQQLRMEARDGDEALAARPVAVRLRPSIREELERAAEQLGHTLSSYLSLIVARNVRAIDDPAKLD